MLDTLKSLATSLRPPHPQEHLQLPVLQAGDARLALASGMTPQEAVDRLTTLAVLPETGSVLVIPSVANRPGRGAHPHLVAAMLANLGPRAVLGIPHGTPAPVRRRWEQLAAKRAGGSVRLGSAGWDAVELDGDGYRLDRVFLPVELRQFDNRLAVPAIGDASLGLGFIATVAHPHTRLRAGGTVERSRLEVEIARAVECSYLLDATRLPGLIAANLAAYAGDAVTIELAALAILRFIDHARGFETTGAWEEARVQAAAELGMGPSTGDNISLVVHEQDARLKELADFIALELSCQLTWQKDGMSDA